jgi:hypothetical protein
MSTLVAQTLSNGSVSTSTANCIQGSAKAWVNFNGTGTVAIRASYNVSSITDNGTGNYTLNFTNALADADYAIATSNEANGGLSVANPNGTTVSTTALTIACYRANGTAEDSTRASVSIFR